MSVSSYSTSTPTPVVDTEERGAVGDARGLLHVVRDDHDRVALLQRLRQLLDGQRRHRVQGRGRLVEQQHVGLDGDRPRDAQPLLLATGQAERARLQSVLDLVPQRRAAQRLLDALIQPRAHAEVARRPGDVVVDRLRERIRLLEDHPDAPPHLDAVGLRPVEVVAVVEHLAGQGEPGDRVVHAVEAAQEGRLAAPGGTDDRRDQVAVDRQRHARHRRLVAVGDRDVAGIEHDLAARRRS